jgi:hypothetical protein
VVPWARRLLSDLVILAGWTALALTAYIALSWLILGRAVP